MMRITTLGVFLFSLFSTTANAALIDHGNGMVYDDVLNITWLQDANSGGIKEWDDAVAWANSLSFGGFDNWRLPSMDVYGDGTIVDCRVVSQTACQDNELGYMFYYNLLGSSGADLTGDQGPFTNIYFDHWSSTDYVAIPLWTWRFEFLIGEQQAGDNDERSGAWAVHPGNVGVVPLPAGVWLLASGLLGLAGLRSNKQRS